MPLGSRLLAWRSRQRLLPQPGARQLVLLVLLAIVAVPFYIAAGLWFDLVYAGLRSVSRGRLSPRLGSGIAAFAVLAVYATAAATPPSPVPPSPSQMQAPGVAASGSGPASTSSVGASPTDAAAASGAWSPLATVPPTAPSEATATSPDADDEATTGGTVPLATPATSTDPSADAAGRLAGEPDPALTPGAFNPAVTQATIGTTICVSGWTATVRPSSSYTTRLKIEQIATYGYADTSTASYEEDHLVPLELGGAPSDPRNLWPEPYQAALPDGRDTGARVKDSLENMLKRDVCAGEITLAEARAEIGLHWVHVFYGIPVLGSAATAGPRPEATPVTTAPGPPLSVTFAGVNDPVPPGSKAGVSATTSAGAICTIKVTLPSGRVSTVATLLQARTVGATGTVSWQWTITSTTGTGQARVLVGCTLGSASGAASTTFRIGA